MKSQKKIDFGAWDLEATFGLIGPQDLSSHKSRALNPILTSRSSFSQESWGKSNKLTKSRKIS